MVGKLGGGASRLLRSLLILCIVGMIGFGAGWLTAKELKPIGIEETPEIQQPTTTRTLRVFAIFATPIEEPWDNVIHQALLKAEKELNIEYEWSDNNGYGAEFERALREAASRGYDIIFGDAFGNEEIVRRVAIDYPKTYFVFGSALGPMEPNVAVFDNWIHEPAYLSGMIAGKMTKTNVLGVVAGYPVEEVNRIVNAFKMGVKKTNPSAKVKVAFINSWFDPVKAKEYALAMIGEGADILYAERAGVIEAAKEKGVYAIGNMLDQYEEGPDTVITSVVWDMWPLVRYVITSVRNGNFVAMDLGEWTMMAKGGARLAPFRNFDDKIPQDVKQEINEITEKIKMGLYRVPIDENMPTSD